MRNQYKIIGILALIKLLIHLVGNRNYGFHRDELLHMSVSRNLSFGYMEFPPLIAWIGKLSQLTFGYSLYGMRLFPTLAGIIILILCCLIAKEFGGSDKGILLAGIANLAFLPFYRNHLLFQPVAFDQLFFTLGFYFLIKFLNTKKDKYLIFVGIAAGFGLLNKYTFLIWVIAFVIAIAFFQHKILLKNKYLYLAGLIAFAMFLPNIIWQYMHNFPIILHLEALKESQLDKNGPFDFVIDQITLAFTFVFSLFGLYWLTLGIQAQKFRIISLMIILIFATMWITGSKGYYFFAVYPILFAAAAIQMETLFIKKPLWIYTIAAILIFPVFFYLPKDIPVLPIEKFIAYADLHPDQNGHFKLTGDYADMFGWDEQVEILNKTFASLSSEDQKHCLLLASNYGEAGAICILDSKNKLPEPVCASGSFWLNGPGKSDNCMAVSIGIDSLSLHKLYSDIKLAAIINHKYAIEEEQNVRIYICRNPKMSLQQIWPQLESSVFK